MWYSLEIIYDGTKPGEIEMHRVKNLTGGELKLFREQIFFSGLFVKTADSLTEGEIISPFRLRKILVYMQQKKFE